MALVGGALTVVSLAAARGADRMAAAGTTLHRDAIPGFEHGAALARLFERQRGLAARAPAELDLGRQAGFRKEFEANAAMLEKIPTDMAGGLDNASKSVLDRVANELKRMNAAAAKVFDLAQNFAQDQANEVLNGDYATIEAGIGKNIDTLFNRNHDRASGAATTLLEAHELMQVVVVATAAASIVLVLAIGLVLVRNITSRIGRLTLAMSGLARQDLAVAVPAATDADEVGEMARSVVVFKENMVAARDVAAREAEAQAAQARRSRAIEDWAAAFDKDAADTLDAVVHAANQMRSTATGMSATVDEASRQSPRRGAAAGQASSNCQTVATAAGEVSTSIAEIGQHGSQSV